MDSEEAECEVYVISSKAHLPRLNQQIIADASEVHTFSSPLSPELQISFLKLVICPKYLIQWNALLVGGNTISSAR